MTRPPTKTPLERLQEAGKLILVRSGWCEPEAGEENTWRQVLTVDQGLQLAAEGKALWTVDETERQVLRPA